MLNSNLFRGPGTSPFLRFSLSFQLSADIQSTKNNEAEALRSWRAALDQIYYHNAYRVPSNYIPRTETEKALFDSLKQLELQCKERVDLLEALRASRKEAAKDERSEHMRRKLEKGKSAESLPPERSSSWLGEGTVSPLQQTDLTRPPPLPARPPISTSRSTETMKGRSSSLSGASSTLGAPPTLPIPSKHVSRSPSPDHGRRPMRTTLRPDKKSFRSARSTGTLPRRPAPVKAAGLAWDSQPRPSSQVSLRQEPDPTIEARLSATAARRSLDQPRRQNFQNKGGSVKTLEASDSIPDSFWREPSSSSLQPSLLDEPLSDLHLELTAPPPTSSMNDLIGLDTPPPPPPPPHASLLNDAISKNRTCSPPKLSKPPDISYRKEYPSPTSRVPASLAKYTLDKAYQNKFRTSSSGAATGISRKPVPSKSADLNRKKSPQSRPDLSSGSEEDTRRRPRAAHNDRAILAKSEGHEDLDTLTPPSTDIESPEEEAGKSEWDFKVDKLMKTLPKGIDENAAKNILNEIVVKGDEVHWEDVAGLEGAKKALKEAVVYPFLRPDLFMGLREPARGMLLFGPPGTGKTMLARAVATESKSTFFAISASSLTSKWHGESEKLVRALFALAKALAPSIIFVDEIDSLLSARSGSTEHEASRRSKTEFLIQWSDLQRAAAGRDTTIKTETGDATRVLVLAATNVPWDIDDAARRRFVRRQYIPLPEPETRETQIRTLLSHQKHDLDAQDISTLVELTDGTLFFPPSLSFQYQITMLILSPQDFPAQTSQHLLKMRLWDPYEIWAKRSYTHRPIRYGRLPLRISRQAWKIYDPA